jgi:hypothetical protein
MEGEGSLDMRNISLRRKNRKQEKSLAGLGIDSTTTTIMLRQMLNKGNEIVPS